MKQEEVIFIGAGGHALSLAEFARPLLRGYLADTENPAMVATWFGSDEMAPELINEGSLFHMAFVYSRWPVMEKRRRLLDRYEAAGARFATLVAPSAIVTPGSSIGDGSAIMAGAIVNRATLGRHVVVNSGAIVEHDCKIGDNTFIGPGAVIGGFTSIGENCFIGLGARIANGITIGPDISIAMGAIVNRSLTSPGIYHGNPLRLSPFPSH